VTEEQDTQEPPGAVSNQNAEEAPAEQEHRDYGLRRLRSVDDGDEESDDSTDGGASEGTQSTGHPESAG
jgi:hypothetical protein